MDRRNGRIISITGAELELRLCFEHALQVLKLVSDSVPAGDHDEECEACAGGTGFVTNLLAGIGAGAVSHDDRLQVDAPIPLRYKARDDWMWEIGFSEFVRTFAQSPFVHFRRPLAERVRLFLDAPTDNGGLESVCEAGFAAQVIDRLRESGFEEEPEPVRTDLVALDLRDLGFAD